MIRDIREEYKAYRAAERELEKARKVLSDKLEEVKSKKGKSFKQGSKYFQIRKRDGLNYIAKSDRQFNSWLKKDASERVSSARQYHHTTKGENVDSTASQAA